MHLTFCVVVLAILVNFAGAEDVPAWETVFTKEKIESGETTLPYRIAEVGESGGGARPLVIFLHGAGERGNDNRSQLKHGLKDLVAWCEAEKQSCVIVAPQCPRGQWWGKLEGNIKDPAEVRMPEEDSAITKTLLALIDQVVKEKALDQRRIYVTGLSMGGYGTFALVARRPEFFAAAMPVCGGGVLTTAAKIKEVPMWVFHGDADAAVPVVMSREMVKALEEAGGKPKYREYPGVGHDSWTATYADPAVWTWLFAQKR